MQQPLDYLTNAAYSVNKVKPGSVTLSLSGAKTLFDLNRHVFHTLLPTQSLELLEQELRDLFMNKVADGKRVVVTAFSCTEKANTYHCIIHMVTVNTIESQLIPTDPEYAWTIHSSISVFLQEHKIPHLESNRISAHIMSKLFDVDMHMHYLYDQTIKQGKEAARHVVTFTMPYSTPEDQRELIELHDYLKAERDEYEKGKTFDRSIQFGPVSLHNMNNVVDFNIQMNGFSTVDVQITYTKSVQ